MEETGHCSNTDLFKNEMMPGDDEERLLWYSAAG
jgi:hypothetical protein